MNRKRIIGSVITVAVLMFSLGTVVSAETDTSNPIQEEGFHITISDKEDSDRTVVLVERGTSSSPTTNLNKILTNNLYDPESNQAPFTIDTHIVDGSNRKPSDELYASIYSPVIAEEGENNLTQIKLSDRGEDLLLSDVDLFLRQGTNATSVFPLRLAPDYCMPHKPCDIIYVLSFYGFNACDYLLECHAKWMAEVVSIVNQPHITLHVIQITEDLDRYDRVIHAAGSGGMSLVTTPDAFERALYRLMESL